MLERNQRLLEALRCGSVGRVQGRFDTRLTSVYQSLLPHLAAQGMVRELFNLGGETICPESLDRLDDADMQQAPLPLQETPIGHFSSKCIPAPG